GLLALAWRLIADCRLQIADWRAAKSQSTICNLQSAMAWWFLAGTILIAPLPASLTQPSPHSYRAALIAPLYALLAGIGSAAILQLLARIPRARWAAEAVAATLLVVALG